MSLDDASERETVMPPAGRDPVELEVDAMFWNNEGEKIALADLREGLAFRLSQRGE